MRHRALRGDDGATTAEYVGVLVLAVALVLALLGLGIAGRIGEAACRAVQSLFDVAPCGDAPVAMTDEDFRPEPCTTTSRNDTSRGSVDLALVTLGADYGLLWEEKADGTIEVTLVEVGKAGLTAGVGADGGITWDGKDYRGGASAEVSLQLAAEDGGTWVFTDRDEAERTRDWLVREFEEDHAVWPANWINSGVEALTGEQDPPEPNITFRSFGVEADGSGSVSGGAAGISAEVGSSIRVGQRVDERDGSYADYYSVDVSGAIGGQAGPIGLGVGGEASAVVALEHDVDGNPTKLVTTTTVQVERSGLAGLDLVEDGLGALQDSFETIGVTGHASDTNTVVVTSALDLADDTTRDAALAFVRNPINADEIDALMAERGRIGVQEYEGERSGLGLQFEVALGAKLGLDVGYDSETSDVVAAHYLGVPDRDGRRAVVVDTACTLG